MPVYEYECKACENVFEVQQRISDAPLTTCPKCQGQVRKLVSMTSFQLKGGGWYADGYASASAANGPKNGNGADDAKKAEQPAPACSSKTSECAGCPAAANSTS
ncbi:MAG: FmdB family zinc ribbon protein [Desulfopila sp.]